MTTPTVTELRRQLEPVTRDPFVDGLTRTPPGPEPAGRRASDAQAYVVEFGSGALSRGGTPMQDAANGYVTGRATAGDDLRPAHVRAREQPHGLEFVHTPAVLPEELVRASSPVTSCGEPVAELLKGPGGLEAGPRRRAQLLRLAAHQIIQPPPRPKGAGGKRS
jgi:hypothetical protein